MKRATLFVLFACLLATPLGAQEKSPKRTYENRLVPVKDTSTPILGDFPEYVEPIRSAYRLEAPVLVDDEGADLDVRAWRFSYNARAIIEVPNRLKARDTALVIVHPWGVDDGQGWKTPEPAGCAFQCTLVKNQLALKHMKDVIDPLLKKHRGKVGIVAYSLPGTEDPIRKKIYRSVRQQPSPSDRVQGHSELAAKLKSFRYEGQPLPDKLEVSTQKPVLDYFKQFPGLDAGDRFNNKNYWNLPIPVARSIDVAPNDVVFYDAEGYPTMRDFLAKQGIRHVLLAGYNADMCVISTTAGWQNLSKDFDVFLVGDATLATFPGQDSPRHATSTAVAFAALNLFITQTSWIRGK